MTLGIVTNGIKIEFNAQQNGVPVVNRCFVTQLTAVTGADLIAVAGAADAFFQDYKASLHNSYVLANITVTDVSVANGSQIVTPYTTSNQGLITTAPAAANAAVVTSLRTAHTGRSFRGRWYWGGLAEATLLNAQFITVADAAAFSGYISDFITALTAIGKTLVVVSNYTNKILRVVALATEVIGLITDQKIDSQRRRTAN
jgi:hypothetical protein